MREKQKFAPVRVFVYRVGLSRDDRKRLFGREVPFKLDALDGWKEVRKMKQGVWYNTLVRANSHDEIFGGVITISVEELDIMDRKYTKMMVAGSSENRYTRVLILTRCGREAWLYLVKDKVPYKYDPDAEEVY